MTAGELKDSYIIWVLAPLLETDDPELQYYYDFTQSHGEYSKVFQEIGCEWYWINVTINKIDEALDKIANYNSNKTSVVINLCDGDELNGVPGLSVIEGLNRRNLIYTGSDEHFYTITTSKIPMKEAFDKHNVSTAPWKVVDGNAEASQIFKEVGDTMIVKPAISAGSMGLGIRNVVDNAEAYRKIVHEMQTGYHGWKLDNGGLFVEEFIKGREFTTLVVGSSTNPSKLECYVPIERVFHKSLPETEKFLSYERLWNNYYRDEQAMPNDENLYEYVMPEAELIPSIQQLSIDAFKSVGGMGYGRLDIRMNSKTGKLYVLEVNAQCGLSEDEDYTSIGAILRFAKKSFTYLIIQIIEDALMRHNVDTIHNVHLSSTSPVSPTTNRNTPL